MVVAPCCSSGATAVAFGRSLRPAATHRRLVAPSPFPSSSTSSPSSHARTASSSTSASGAAAHSSAPPTSPSASRTTTQHASRRSIPSRAHVASFSTQQHAAAAAAATSSSSQKTSSSRPSAPAPASPSLPGSDFFTPPPTSPSAQQILLQHHRRRARSDAALQHHWPDPLAAYAASSRHPLVKELLAEIYATSTPLSPERVWAAYLRLHLAGNEVRSGGGSVDASGGVRPADVARPMELLRPEHHQLVLRSIAPDARLSRRTSRARRNLRALDAASEAALDEQRATSTQSQASPPPPTPLLPTPPPSGGTSLISRRLQRSTLFHGGDVGDAGDGSGTGAGQGSFGAPDDHDHHDGHRGGATASSSSASSLRVYMERVGFVFQQMRQCAQRHNRSRVPHHAAVEAPALSGPQPHGADTPSPPQPQQQQEQLHLPTVSDYNHVLRTLASGGHIDAITRLWAELRGGSPAPSVAPAPASASESPSLLPTSDSAAATAAAAENVQPNRHTYHALMLAVSRHLSYSQQRINKAIASQVKQAMRVAAGQSVVGPPPALSSSSSSSSRRSRRGDAAVEAPRRPLRDDVVGERLLAQRRDTARRAASLAATRSLELLEEMRLRGLRANRLTLDLATRNLRLAGRLAELKRLVRVGFGVDLDDLGARDRQRSTYHDDAEDDVDGAGGGAERASTWRARPTTHTLNTVVMALGEQATVPEMVTAYEVLTRPLPPPPPGRWSGGRGRESAERAYAGGFDDEEDDDGVLGFGGATPTSRRSGAADVGEGETMGGHAAAEGGGAGGDREEARVPTRTLFATDFRGIFSGSGGGGDDVEVATAASSTARTSGAEEEPASSLLQATAAAAAGEAEEVGSERVAAAPTPSALESAERYGTQPNTVTLRTMIRHALTPSNPASAHVLRAANAAAAAGGGIMTEAGLDVDDAGSGWGAGSGTSTRQQRSARREEDERRLSGFYVGLAQYVVREGVERFEAEVRVAARRLGLELVEEEQEAEGPQLYGEGDDVEVEAGTDVEEGRGTPTTDTVGRTTSSVAAEVAVGRAEGGVGEEERAAPRMRVRVSAHLAAYLDIETDAWPSSLASSLSSSSSSAAAAAAPAPAPALDEPTASEEAREVFKPYYDAPHVALTPEELLPLASFASRRERVELLAWVRRWTSRMRRARELEVELLRGALRCWGGSEGREALRRRWAVVGAEPSSSPLRRLSPLLSALRSQLRLAAPQLEALRESEERLEARLELLRERRRRRRESWWQRRVEGNSTAAAATATAPTKGPARRVGSATTGEEARREERDRPPHQVARVALAH